MRTLLTKHLSVIEIAVRALAAHEYGRRDGEKVLYLNTEFYEQGTYAENDKPVDIVTPEKGAHWTPRDSTAAFAGSRSFA